MGSGKIALPTTSMSNGTLGERTGFPRHENQLDTSKSSAAERSGPPRRENRLNTSKSSVAERSGPPHRENRLAKPSGTVGSPAALQVRGRSLSPPTRAPSPPTRAPSPSTRVPSPPVCVPSPPTHSPLLPTRSPSPNPFPLDAESPEDSMGRSEEPLFLSDEASESESDDNIFYDPDERIEDDPDEGAFSEQDEDTVEDDTNEEVITSMMTGGRFTREQILEVQDLTKSLMIGLRQCAKKWKRPLDSVMRIANLIITTKERRVGGNVWNAFQSTYPEDPQKETRKYSFLLHCL